VQQIRAEIEQTHKQSKLASAASKETAR
jgi:hypothetical protein